MFKEWKEDFIDWIECAKSEIKLFGFFGYVWRSIKNFFWRNTHWLRQIKRIVDYIPILWNDEDWDYEFIFELLKYKLQRTRNEIFDGCGDEKEWKNPRIAEIDEVIKIIDKILNNDFVEEEHCLHEKKYGIIKMESGEKDEKTGLVRCNMYYELSKDNAELQKEASDEARKIYALEEERTQKALDDLFNLLSKNIRKWWD